MTEEEMKNAKINLLTTWMAVLLMRKSKLNDMQKHNVLLSLDQNYEVHVLKNVKKKLKDLIGCVEERPKMMLFARDGSRNR